MVCGGDSNGSRETTTGRMCVASDVLIWSTDGSTADC